METLVKISSIENEVEARVLDDVLTEQEIPHLIRSYHDSALDGLYQSYWGWGHVEAPEDRRDEVMEILYDLRHEVPPSDEELAKPEDPNAGGENL